jgi:hypothetical protein
MNNSHLSPEQNSLIKKLTEETGCDYSKGFYWQAFDGEVIITPIDHFETEGGAADFEYSAERFLSESDRLRSGISNEGASTFSYECTKSEMIDILKNNPFFVEKQMFG